eukprot:5429334-Lingulodinium_polyedra.AAC.1
MDGTAHADMDIKNALEAYIGSLRDLPSGPDEAVLKEKARLELKLEKPKRPATCRGESAEE